MNSKKIIEGLATQKYPEFSPGDTVAVHIKIKEGEKERIQVFEGIVLRKKRGGNSASFSVRKISFGVGVERIFPYQCSNIEKIEVIRRGKVRRAKLFYIRELQGKSLRIDDHQDQSNLNDMQGEESVTDAVGSKKSAKVTKSKEDDTREAASA